MEKWYYARDIGVVRIEALVGGYIPFTPPVVNDLVRYTLNPPDDDEAVTNMTK